MTSIATARGSWTSSVLRLTSSGSGRGSRATCCKESACVKLRLREADGQVGSSAFDRVLV